MARSLERVRTERAESLDSALSARSAKDVSERSFDRFADLYASEERRYRLERTELMIRRAERQLQ